MPAKRLPFSRPMCKYPVLIVNKNAVELIKSCGYYTYLGKFCSFFGSRYFFPWSKFSKMGYALATRYKDSNGFHYKYDYKSLASCYVETDFAFEYLFLVVECRHCPLCVERKRNDYVARCAFESQTSSTPPIMVTLTYEPCYLPHKCYFQHIKAYHCNYDFDKNHFLDLYDKRFYTYETHQYYRDGSIRNYGDGDLCKKDVQRFVNLLRIRLTRAGFKPVNMRYICTGEYGSKSGRPHYHFLFWNVPFNIKSQFDQYAIDLFKSFVLSAWGMCIPKACKVEVARSAARYCTKYMSKIDKRGKKGFFLSSRGKGVDGWKGIGSKFLQLNKDFYESHPTMNSIPFLDKWSGEQMQYTFGSYALQKVFPSGSQYLARTDFKRDFRSLQYDAAYARWLVDHITYYRTARSGYYSQVRRDIYDALWICNLAPSYVNVCIEDYYFDPKIYSPSGIDCSLWKTNFTSGELSHRESVVMEIVDQFYDKCNDFLLKYGDVIDDGYLLYLDGLRFAHTESLPPRDVTDDLIDQLCSAILEKNAIDEAKEIF